MIQLINQTVQKINEKSVPGQFSMTKNGLKISGYEEDIRITYEIQEGKLVEILSKNGHNFKQVSIERPHLRLLPVL